MPHSATLEHCVEHAEAAELLAEQPHWILHEGSKTSNAASNSCHTYVYQPLNIYTYGTVLWVGENNNGIITTTI